MLKAFGVIAFLLGCLQLIEMFEAREIQGAIELIQRNALVSVRLVDRVTRDIEREQVLVGQHIFERDVPTMLNIERLVADVRKDYLDVAREYSPLTTFSNEAYTWHELTADVATAQAQEDAALALSRVNRDIEATQLMASTKPLFDRIDQGAATLVDINQRAADRAAEDAIARQRIDSLVQAVVTAGILIIVLLGGGWVTRSVVGIHHELEQANRELENRNRELDAFAGRIAHDLRGPLNTISLSTELLDVTAPPATTISATIRRGTVQIARLIDDLLALSRIGAMPQTIARTEPVASSLREDLGRLVDEAHGVLHVNLEPAQVQCTESLLRQALWNLGENAVKYRRPDVAPEIDVAGRSEPEQYTIRVSDNGVGMNNDDARHVFEPFFRSPRTSAIAGTGLGLAIVRRIIEASGGRVSLESQLGHGTTFVITLPLAHAVTPTPM